jgi:crotonobetainyl-CoA:carnitine CoA-transferase CaiB-like acyl-CoA transferase
LIGITGEEIAPLPFEGVVVIDMSRVLAGPTVSRLLVEFGADVIKVEAAPNGDVSRSLPYLRDGRSGYYIQANRGKRSVCVDFRSERGKELILALAARADVLVENYRPGVLDDMGLGWDRLRAANPRLILCSVTALGYGGPLSQKPGYDTIGAALSGIAYVSGRAGGPPMMPRAAMGDTMTGVHGFAGVATALYRREKTGLGDWIQVSLLDTYLHSHEINIQEYSGSRGAIDPGPAGSNPPPVSPGGFYRCGERYIFIACVADDDWRRLATAMGRSELGTDPRYLTNGDRVAHNDELQKLVSEWVASIGKPAEVTDLLDRHGVCAEIVYSVAEATRHPHNLARRGVRTVPDDVWGEITIPGVPIRFASVPVERDLRAHELGADTREVLSEVLSMDEATIDGLYAAGVVKGGGVTLAPADA